MIYVDNPIDRPYGPTNPDYEYDRQRQENDEAQWEAEVGIWNRLREEHERWMADKGIRIEFEQWLDQQENA